MRVRVSIIILAVCVLSTGCSTRLADLTVVSTKGVKWEGLRPYSGMQRVEGTDARHYILMAIPVTGPANIEEAVDEALETGQGDTLMDAVLYGYWWFIPPLYRQSGFKVTGSVLDSKAK